jgi:hypothetical protein
MNYFIVYPLFGVLFMVSIWANLNNYLYKDLTLYYYNWSKIIQKLYIIYIFVVVFLFWPLFLFTLLLDIIGVKKRN